MLANIRFIDCDMSYDNNVSRSVHLLVKDKTSLIRHPVCATTFSDYKFLPSVNHMLTTVPNTINHVSIHRSSRCSPSSAISSFTAAVDWHG